MKVDPRLPIRERIETVGDIGEVALLRRISSRITGRDRRWVGDDTAVLPSPGKTLLYTTDGLVEGVDFDLSYCTGEDVGWKAIAVNASDVAAMGGSPCYAVGALALRSDTPVSLVDGILDGMTLACSRWGIALVGGDIGEASELSLTVAMIGSPCGEEVVTRRGARPGDAICVTGALGGAAGGLRALSARLAGGRWSGAGVLARTGPGGNERLAARHLRPQARVEEARRLCEVGVSAMIDVSDGFARDLDNLLEASRVGCNVDVTALPVDRDLLGIAARIDDFEPLLAAILGGDDYELVFTLPEDRVANAVDALKPMGTAVTRVGSVREGERVLGPHRLSEWKERAWEHLRPR